MPLWNARPFHLVDIELREPTARSNGLQCVTGGEGSVSLSTGPAKRAGSFVSWRFIRSSVYLDEPNCDQFFSVKTVQIARVGHIDRWLWSRIRDSRDSCHYLTQIVCRQSQLLAHLGRLRPARARQDKVRCTFCCTLALREIPDMRLSLEKKYTPLGSNQQPSVP